MITLSDLRGSVRRAPLTKEKPAPKWKELINSGEEVVAEVIFADGTTVEVYANGYVHYFNGKNHTTFSLTDVEQDYTYQSLGQASSKIELDYFDKLPWIIRVLMEGDDRVESSQSKARITKNMVSFDTNKDELGTYGCDSEDALAIMLKDELEEMLYQSFLFMTEYQQKIIEACILDTRALKAALDDFPREDHRHGIIHDCLPTEKGIKIASEYGIQMPVQSAFINWKQEPDEYLVSILGEERAAKLNPLKTFKDNGIAVSFGSDAPCTTPDPIVWMDKAVHNKDESVTPEEALRMCTYNGYRATFDENRRGSLELGKVADMVILSENPYTAEDIASIKVEQLILHGEPYKSAKENPIPAILRGMTSNGKA